MNGLLPDGALSAIVQVAIALIASGLAVKLLTLRQDRRKIAGDASSSEANAASTLSGAALQMVESQKQTTKEANARASQNEQKMNESRAEAQFYWRELQKASWEVYWQKSRVDVLEATLRAANIPVQEAPRPVMPDFPPPALPELTPLPPPTPPELESAEPADPV